MRIFNRLFKSRGGVGTLASPSNFLTTIVSAVVGGISYTPQASAAWVKIFNPDGTNALLVSSHADFSNALTLSKTGVATSVELDTSGTIYLQGSGGTISAVVMEGYY